MTSPLPHRVLAYYGDDFTGSTDVMEAMTINGLPTVLFLDVPTASDLARFPDARAVGIAGTSRARSPDWMRAHLPDALGSLAALGTPLIQYKICSTFDSSPSVGSIGCAIDVGRAALEAASAVPIVVGAPPLKRYVAFGNLFATVGRDTHRLDRHPTMSRHPVTPMAEADLVRHLAAQTAARVDKFDLLALASGDYVDRFRTVLAQRPDAILFDTLDEESLRRIGELVWGMAAQTVYCVASSGLNYALAEYWRSRNWIRAAAPAPAARCARVAVVSGSCSPVTAQQIEHAAAAGFVAVAADARRLATPSDSATEVARLRTEALRALASGASVVVYTARGPDDPAVAAYHEHLRRGQETPETSNERVGLALGDLLRAVILEAGIRRAVVCGGDTSGHAMRSLGISALSLCTPLAPGSPLCTAHSSDARLADLEMALKGGQVGARNYFTAVLEGTA